MSDVLDDRPPYEVTLDEIQERFSRIMSHARSHPVPSSWRQDLYDELEAYDPQITPMNEVKEPINDRLLHYLFVGWMISENMVTLAPTQESTGHAEQTWEVKK